MTSLEWFGCATYRMRTEGLTVMLDACIDRAADAPGPGVRTGVPPERMICVARGETIALGEGVSVSVLPSQHSCIWSDGQMHQPGEVCLGDLGVTWQEQQARMQELTEHMGSSLSEASIAHLLAGMVSHSQRGHTDLLELDYLTPATVL